jgi:hypothetical protein
VRPEVAGGELAVEMLERGRPHVIVDAIAVRPSG